MFVIDDIKSLDSDMNAEEVRAHAVRVLDLASQRENADSDQGGEEQQVLSCGGNRSSSDSSGIWEFGGSGAQMDDDTSLSESGGMVKLALDIEGETRGLLLTALGLVRGILPSVPGSSESIDTLLEKVSSQLYL